ncbi:hypothetical protein ACLOJK_040685 [Asimina triloba]
MNWDMELCLFASSDSRSKEFIFRNCLSRTNTAASSFKASFLITIFLWFSDENSQKEEMPQVRIIAKNFMDMVAALPAMKLDTLYENTFICEALNLKFNCIVNSCHLLGWNLWWVEWEDSGTEVLVDWAIFLSPLHNLQKRELLLDCQML